MFFQFIVCCLSLPGNCIMQDGEREEYAERFIITGGHDYNKAWENTSFIQVLSQAIIWAADK